MSAHVRYVAYEVHSFNEGELIKKTLLRAVDSAIGRLSAADGRPARQLCYGRASNGPLAKPDGQLAAVVGRPAVAGG